jgi:hypothetical protein
MLIAVGLVALLAQVILSGARAWREYVPRYEPGALADRTLITPVPLTVIDPEATEQEQAKEARRLPPLYRFDARAADQAVERFLADYEQRQTLFLQGLRRKWATTPTADDLASPLFTDYVAAFRLAHPDFPLSDQLAAAWALETEPPPIRNQTMAALRGAFRQYVVSDESPAEATGHAEVFVSPPGDAGGVLDPGDVESRANRLQRRALIPVSKVRGQLHSELAAHGPEWTDFVTRFIRANVTLDAGFTVAARQEFARDIRVEVAFRPGDQVITVAHPVTEVQAAALESLRAHYAALTTEQTWQQWWLGGFGLLLVGLGILAGRRTRAAQAGGELMIPAPTESPAAQLAAVRQGLIQQLGNWLKLQFVQRLIQQRNEALAAQADASRQAEVLSDRLTKLHPEIRERVADYERRIAQLERELSTSNEVTRELIKTKISLARKELEIEKARSNLVWN